MAEEEARTFRIDENGSVIVTTDADSGEYKLENIVGDLAGHVSITRPDKTGLFTAYIETVIATFKQPWHKEGFYPLFERVKIAVSFWDMHELLVPPAKLTGAAAPEFYAWNLKRWNAMDLAGVPRRPEDFFECMMSRPTRRLVEKERDNKSIFALMRRTKRLANAGVHKQPKNPRKCRR